MKPSFRFSHKVYAIPGADETQRTATGATLTVAMKFERMFESPSAAAKAQAQSIFDATLGETLADDGMPPARETLEPKRTRGGYAGPPVFSPTPDGVLLGAPPAPAPAPGGAAAGSSSAMDAYSV
jgi:hypothetical protein